LTELLRVCFSERSGGGGGGGSVSGERGRRPAAAGARGVAKRRPIRRLCEGRARTEAPRIAEALSMMVL